MRMVTALSLPDSIEILNVPVLFIVSLEKCDS